MPRANRSNLAQKLAAVALGAATLAITAGQLPAQAAAAYGPLPPVQPIPGGFTAVVASTTIGPAGGTIGPVTVNGCTAVLTVPAGTFATPVQITITAPSASQVGNAGHPGDRAVCGVGVLIQVNGTLYTGKFGHSLTLTIAGFGIKPGDRVAVWDGKAFVFVSATVAGATAQIKAAGANDDFAVLAPGGGRSGSLRSEATVAARSSQGTRAAEAVLTSLFLAPASLSPAGIGVLAPEWLAIISR